MQPEENQNYNQPPMDTSQFTPPQPQQEYQENILPQQYSEPQLQPEPQPVIAPTPQQVQPQPTIANYAQTFQAQANDPVSIYLEKIKRSPGKSLMMGAIVLSLFSTVLPWVGAVFTTSSSNYYGLIGRNMFAILYLFALLFIAFHRYTLWFSLENFKPYKKIFDYIETLCAGGILMFTFAMGVYDSIQIGLIFSVLANIGIVSYLTYIRFYKKANEDNTSNINI